MRDHNDGLNARVRWDAPARSRERALRLSEPEAMALLDICLLGEFEDSGERASALRKLADLCREFLAAGCDDEPEPRAAHGSGRTEPTRVYIRRQLVRGVAQSPSGGSETVAELAACA